MVKTTKTIIASLAFLIMGKLAFAIPSLQLYIDPAANPGAYFDAGSQTWVYPNSSPFTLSAFALDKDLGSTAGNAFNGSNVNAVLSVALEGSLPLGSAGDTTPASTFGTVTINGNVLPGSWTYGTPPLATVTTKNGGADLPTHGEFPTWFAEYSFNFGAFGASVFDTQPGQTGTDRGYRKDFTINISSLTAGVSTAHFDLYTLASDGKSIYANAPFSHDAEADNNRPSNPVPEPATLSLLGLGLVGFGLKKVKKS